MILTLFLLSPSLGSKISRTNTRYNVQSKPVILLNYYCLSKTTLYNYNKLCKNNDFKKTKKYIYILHIIMFFF